MDTQKLFHFKDKNGDNINLNEVFVHEDGKCYCPAGSGMTSKKKHLNEPTAFVNGEGKIVWKLSTEMVPFTLS